MKLPTYVLRLYVNRSRMKSVQAIANITGVCEQYLKGRYNLEVIDACEHADLARADQIVALPTLIKGRPLPFQRLVGDMSDVDKVLGGLSLKMQGH